MVIQSLFYCQAQPKPKLQLGAELVIISANPTTHPPNPPTHPPDKYEGAWIQLPIVNKSYLAQWVDLKTILKFNLNQNSTMPRPKTIAPARLSLAQLSSSLFWSIFGYFLRPCWTTFIFYSSFNSDIWLWLNLTSFFIFWDPNLLFLGSGYSSKLFWIHFI